MAPSGTAGSSRTLRGRRVHFRHYAVVFLATGLTVKYLALAWCVAPAATGKYRILGLDFFAAEPYSASFAPRAGPDGSCSGGNCCELTEVVPEALSCGVWARKDPNLAYLRRRKSGRYEFEVGAPASPGTLGKRAGGDDGDPGPSSAAAERRSSNDEAEQRLREAARIATWLRESSHKPLAPRTVQLRERLIGAIGLERSGFVSNDELENVLVLTDGVVDDALTLLKDEHVPAVRLRERSADRESLREIARALDDADLEQVLRRAGGHIEHALNHLENLAADPLPSRGDVLANLRDGGDDEAEGDGSETMRGGDTRHL